MKNFKKFTIGMIGASLLSFSLYSCNNDDILDQENNTDNQYAAKGETPTEYEFFFRERRELALKNFSEALVKSMAESMELRSLIKSEALKKFNNDTEVLISQLAELELREGTVASKLNQHLQGTRIEEILNIIPTLTVLVPELPKESFSAERWDTNNELPMVAIRTTLSNDNPVVNWAEGKLETGVIPSNIIPAYPILVAKINERVISNFESDFSKSETREFHTSKFTGISYRFADVAYDGKLFPVKIRPIPSNVDSTIAEAYNLTNNSDAWQRDHIYYNINTSTPNGPFNYKFKEYLGFVSPKEYNGSAQGAYDAFADQTDPRYNGVKRDGNWNDWTDGSYELVFHFLLNDANGNGGNEIKKNISVKPSDLFQLEYDHRVETHNVFWKRNIFTLRSIKAKKYWADLEAFSWNLENFAAKVRVKVFEKDPDQEQTITINSSSKAATNFGIDIGADLFKIVKLGIKFGTSNERNTSHNYQIKTTFASDDLGMSDIDFGEPVVTGKYTFGRFFIDIYTLNSYSTGTIDFSLTPKRVQQ